MWPLPRVNSQVCSSNTALTPALLLLGCFGVSSYVSQLSSYLLLALISDCVVPLVPALASSTEAISPCNFPKTQNSSYQRFASVSCRRAMFGEICYLWVLRAVFFSLRLYYLFLVLLLVFFHQMESPLSIQTQPWPPDQAKAASSRGSKPASRRRSCLVSIIWGISEAADGYCCFCPALGTPDGAGESNVVCRPLSSQCQHLPFPSPVDDTTNSLSLLTVL